MSRKYQHGKIINTPIYNGSGITTNLVIRDENPNYVSPSLSRSGEKKKKTGSYAKRMKALERLQKREEENVLPEDELGDVFE